MVSTEEDRPTNEKGREGEEETNEQEEEGVEEGAQDDDEVVGEEEEARREEEEYRKAQQAEKIRRQREIAMRNATIRRCVLEATDDAGASWKETELSLEDVTRTADGEIVIKANGRAQWIGAWAGTKAQTFMAVRERLCILKICRLFNSMNPPRKIHVQAVGVLTEEQPDRPVTYRYVAQWCMDPELYKISSSNQTAFAFSLFSWIVSNRTLLVLFSGRIGKMSDMYMPVLHRVTGSKLDRQAIDDFLSSALRRHKGNVVCKALGLEATGILSCDPSGILSGKLAPPALLKTGEVDLIPSTAFPRTYVVDLEGYGDHSNIEDAIAAADRGDRIVLHPGVYSTPLEINKGVIIAGQGTGSVIFKPANDSTEPAIRINGADAQLLNLVIHAPLKTDCPALVVSEGSPVIQACDIIGQVVVEGDSAPNLHANRIRQSKSHGLVLSGSCTSAVADNDISENAGSGIFVTSSGTCLLTENKIYRNGEAGIFFGGGAPTNAIGNNISENKGSGIRVEDEESTPVVRECAVFRNNGSGMDILGGRGVFEANRIDENELAGIFVANTASPALFRNEICSNAKAGVLITNESKPFLDENNIHSNGLEGILVENDAQPTICENRIHDGQDSGLVVGEGGSGKIVGNRVYDNANVDILILSNRMPTLERNKLCA